MREDVKKSKDLKAVPNGRPTKAPAAQAVWQAQFESADKLPGAIDRTISDHP